jgi:hypothetical protein
MAPTRRVRWLALLAALVLFRPVAAEATTAVLLDDVALVKHAVAIVIGRVVEMKAYTDPVDGRIWTLVRLDVDEILKGPVAPGPMTIRQLGGTVGGRAAWVEGSPEFTAGEKALLFLDQHGDGALRVAHLFQGKFTIMGDVLTADQFAYRELPPAGVTVLPSASGLAAPHTYGVYRLDDLRLLIASLAAGAPPPARPVLAAPAVPPGAAAEPTQFVSRFVLIDGCGNLCPRWFEPDSAGAVPVLIDGRGAAENVAGSIAAVRDALAAWSNVPGSSFRYVDAGFTPPPNPGGFRRDGLTAVWFRDPAGDMSPPVNCQGTLAIGGITAFNSAETKTISGRNFSRTLEGDVVFNRGWGGCGRFEDSSVLAEIATHELGHVLGLGHTSDPTATMAPEVHADGRGASLRPDDIAGLRFIYPSRHSLAIGKAGNGSGTVASPSGLLCGTICAAELPPGTSVTLTATASAGSVFTGWGGDCTPAGINPTCQVVVNGGRVVTAAFRIAGTDFTGAGTADVTIHDRQNGNWFVGRSTGASFTIEHWVGGFGNRGASEQSFVGDFTGDGKADVAIHDAQTGIWHVGRSTGASFTIELWALGFGNRGSAVERVSVGDFTGDGKTDVAIHDTQTGTWHVGRSTGAGFAIELWALGFGNRGSAVERVYVGDFTGDGKGDVAIHNVQTGDWFVGRSTGAAFVVETWASRLGTRGPAFEQVFVADFTGDGKTDVAIHDRQTGTWVVGRSTGSAFVTEPWATGFGNRGPAVEEVFVADFTGDGRADVAIHDRQTGNWFVGRSTGSALAIEPWATGFGNLGPAAEEVLLGDFTGDGLTDVAIHNKVTGDWFIGRSTGAGFGLEPWVFGFGNRGDAIEEVLTGFPR